MDQSLPSDFRAGRKARSLAESAGYPAAWLGRIWSSIVQRGRLFAPIPSASIEPLERAKMLASSLLSARGEASGAAVAQELIDIIGRLPDADRHLFLNFIAEGFQADVKILTRAAQDYLAQPSAATAARIAEAAEPSRQELLRRMNMADGGTAVLVAMRKELPALLETFPALAALDADLRHLFASWFNRGFLQLRQIDWQTPAATLEKLIAYEAVHAIRGWDDLRRRLAPDRRCFAFFHPALPGEPLIFVEVALVTGLANSVQALLELDTDEAMQRERATTADTAIFYSISNCQDGLRGISFGNFLIKQVVEILSMELPGLRHFSTLSPVPGFRRWLEPLLERDGLPEVQLSPSELERLREAISLVDASQPLSAVVRAALAIPEWEASPSIREALEPALLKLCAAYLTRPLVGQGRIDPVARFHLGNGARLERINWMGNPGGRGMRESWGIMVNYLYDPQSIETNHEGFTRAGEVARSSEVDQLLKPQSPRRRRTKPA